MRGGGGGGGGGGRLLLRSTALPILRTKPVPVLALRVGID
jgi:hypothetical protein